MNIRNIRKQKNVTQKELANLTGIPHRTIQWIEANNDCKVSIAVKIADALNVTLNDLVYKTGDQ